MIGASRSSKPPPGTKPGWNAYDTCSRCDYTTYTELTALNHDLEQHAAQAPHLYGNRLERLRNLFPL